MRQNNAKSNKYATNMKPRETMQRTNERKKERSKEFASARGLI